MRLKLATSTLLLFGILLVFGWPWIIGTKPPMTAHRELAQYSVKLGFYFIACVLVWGTVAFLAVLVARREREEYRRRSRENLESLIEGALRDHVKGEGNEHQP